MGDDKGKTGIPGQSRDESRLLDEESFARAAEMAFREAGAPAVDEMAKRRVWNRVESRLNTRTRGWWPLYVVMPLAAAIAIYVFFPRDGGVGSDAEVDLPGSGVKGAGEMLPVSMDVMEARDDNRFLPLNLDGPVPPGTRVALMVRGAVGNYALITMQRNAGPHEVISADYALPGQEGALLVSGHDQTGEIWKMALPSEPDKIRLCAVASTSPQNLASLIPSLREAGDRLPAMMECQTIYIGRSPGRSAPDNRDRE